MSNRRRKYEPAGGVVALDWQKGKPASGDEFGTVLVETWEASAHPFTWNGTPQICVTARLCVATWQHDAQAWSMPLDRVRRWARLDTRTVRVSLTLDDWGRT